MKRESLEPKVRLQTASVTVNRINPETGKLEPYDIGIVDATYDEEQLSAEEIAELEAEIAKNRAELMRYNVAKYEQWFARGENPPDPMYQAWKQQRMHGHSR